MKQYIIFISLSLLAISSCNQEDHQPRKKGRSTEWPDNYKRVTTVITEDSAGLADSSLGDFCLERLPIPPITVKEVSLIEREDGRIDSIINYKTLDEFESLSQNLYTCAQFLWEKDTLKVKFLDGNENVKNRVKQTAKQWEQYCSIVFDFSDAPLPDITISFRFGVNESCIGNTSQYQSPSMKLATLRESSPQQQFDRVVLHEFGHALGFFHEHLHPALEIPWNEEYLFEYFGRSPNNWSREKTRKNLLEKPAFSNCSGAPDIESIMMYEITGRMVSDPAFITIPPNRLSELDKRNIASYYPK